MTALRRTNAQPATAPTAAPASRLAAEGAPASPKQDGPGTWPPTPAQTQAEIAGQVSSGAQAPQLGAAARAATEAPRA
eukprot:5204475-Pyramimonas_sp.AAC.1